MTSQDSMVFLVSVNGFLVRLSPATTCLTQSPAPPEGRSRMFLKKHKLVSTAVYSENITVTENAYVWSAPYLMNSPVIEYTGEAILVLLGIPTNFIDLVINYINRYFVEHVSSSNITVPINSLKPTDNQIPKYHYCN